MTIVLSSIDIRPMARDFLNNLTEVLKTKKCISIRIRTMIIIYYDIHVYIARTTTQAKAFQRQTLWGRALRNHFFFNQKKSLYICIYNALPSLLRTAKTMDLIVWLYIVLFLTIVIYTNNNFQVYIYTHTLHILTYIQMYTERDASAAQRPVYN